MPEAVPQRSERQRILLVDDEPVVLNCLRAMLERSGYSVLSTTSLQVALDAIEKHRFHLVVSDLYLGEEDLGYQLADRARSRKPSIPVVLLTGRPSFDSAVVAMRSRVSEILVKPVDLHSVVTTCRQAIQEADLLRRNHELDAQNQVLASVLPRAIEAKDPTTSGHAERVVHYTEALARRCGIGEEERADLRMAALLHDVGKIGIPDQILTKPGGLTLDEREVIKRHPQMGYDILEPMRDRTNVREWVYQHHERWDGRGYPNGLHAADVALPGRILVLAEVYDALAEARSYKQPWPIQKIAAYFREEAAKQFDPELAHMVASGLETEGAGFFASQASLA